MSTNFENVINLKLPSKKTGMKLSTESLALGKGRKMGHSQRKS